MVNPRDIAGNAEEEEEEREQEQFTCYHSEIEAESQNISPSDNILIPSQPPRYIHHDHGSTSRAVSSTNCLITAASTKTNVTTLMVGLKKNGYIRKNLTQNGEPQRYSWGTQKEDNCCDLKQKYHVKL